MSAIKTQPPISIWAGGVTRHIGLRKGQSSMNINRSNRESVAIGTMPAMAQRHTNIATTVAMPIVGHHPLKAKVLALGKHMIGTRDSNREAHEEQKKERWRETVASDSQQSPHGGAGAAQPISNALLAHALLAPTASTLLAAFRGPQQHQKRQ
jgi:hypothetical protein